MVYHLTLWLAIVYLFCFAQGIPFILVGTKLDLRDDQDACKRLAERRQTPISFSEAQGLASDLAAYRYLECSALTQHGLKQVRLGWVRFSGA